MIDIKEYGFKDDEYIVDEALFVGRVTATHKNMYNVVFELGEKLGILKTGNYYSPDFDSNEVFPTTGDYVVVENLDDEQCLIHKTYPRYSYFERKDADANKNEQVMAANFDTVFIVSSLNDDFNLNRIERFLVAAYTSKAKPVIILTKADLCDNVLEKVAEVENRFVGVDVCAISVYTNYGMETLNKYLIPKTTLVFLGSSGVGKSSLVNAIAEEEIMTTNEIRESDSKGKHTTTHRQLIKLKNGVIIIDTPGVRSIGVWDASLGISNVYDDINDLFTKCKFSDCTHTVEPGCAINDALDSGELDEKRWKNYQQLQKEVQYSENKVKVREMKNNKSKEISKYLKSRKKNKKMY